MIALDFTRSIVAASTIVFLCSCRSAPTRLFTLDPVAPTSIASSYGGPAIRVDAIHVPPALDRIEIASEVAPGEYKVNELDHWIAPLAQITRQTLTADLIARLPRGRVIFPRLARPIGAIGINVDLLSFSSDRDGARLYVSWVGISDGPQPRSCGGTLTLRIDRESAGPGSTANALSRLLAELADGIVAELMLLPPADPS